MCDNYNYARVFAFRGQYNNGQFTNYDIIGGNFGTKSTLAHMELTQRHMQFLSERKSLSYGELTLAGEKFLT